MKYQASQIEIDQYVSEGWWEESKRLSDFVEDNVLKNPSGTAYQVGDVKLSWEEYLKRAKHIGQIIQNISREGDRVLVWLPDNENVHVSYLACELAGAIAVGVGWKAGLQELKHLTETTGASMLLTSEMNSYGTRDDISKYLKIESVAVDTEFLDQIIDSGVFRAE